MVTTNGLRVPYGTLDPERGGMVIRFVFDFSTGATQDYLGISGDGSARNVHEMQSVFVDNALNAFSVRITCDGSGHEFIVPAQSQAFLPVFCAENAFGIHAIAPNAGAFYLPILLMQKPMDFCVWSVGATATPATAAEIRSATQNTLYSQSLGGNNIGVLTVGTTPLLIMLSGMQVVTLTNRGTTSIFIGGSGVTPATGYEMIAGQTLNFSGPRASSNIFGVVATGTQPLHRISW